MEFETSDEICDKLVRKEFDSDPSLTSNRPNHVVVIQWYDNDDENDDDIEPEAEPYSELMFDEISEEFDDELQDKSMPMEEILEDIDEDEFPLIESLELSIFAPIILESKVKPKLTEKSRVKMSIVKKEYDAERMESNTKLASKIP